MHHLIYVSAASHLMADDELMAILEVSRDRNAADGITGMLLYKDGSFMQLLEGETAMVKETYNRIARDERHHGLITLCGEDTDERLFPNWSMGFRSVRAQELEAVPGFTRLGAKGFLDPSLAGEPHVALDILKTFNDTTT